MESNGNFKPIRSFGGYFQKINQAITSKEVFHGPFEIR